MPYTVDPANVPADRVRFLIGDTVVASPELSDYEVDYLLSLYPDDPLSAAARAAEALAGKYAKAVDKSVGNLRISNSQKAEGYRKLAAQLWRQATRGTFVPGSVVAPWAGGISRSDKLARERDTDRVRPAFRRRLMEYPGGLDERLGPRIEEAP